MNFNNYREPITFNFFPDMLRIDEIYEGIVTDVRNKEYILVSTPDLGIENAPARYMSSPFFQNTTDRGLHFPLPHIGDKVNVSFLDGSPHKIVISPRASKIEDNLLEEELNIRVKNINIKVDTLGEHELTKIGDIANNIKTLAKWGYGADGYLYQYMIQLYA